MISLSDIEAHEARLCEALEAAVGFRVRNLAKGLRRAGRLVPRSVHTRVEVFAQARALIGHPKLALMLEADTLAQAEAAILAELKSIDLADRRRGRRLGMAGAIVFNLLVVVALFIGWMVWAGHL